jgi:hypothetical protein
LPAFGDVWWLPAFPVLSSRGCASQLFLDLGFQLKIRVIGWEQGFGKQKFRLMGTWEFVRKALSKGR